MKAAFQGQKWKIDGFLLSLVHNPHRYLATKWPKMDGGKEKRVRVVGDLPSVDLDAFKFIAFKEARTETTDDIYHSWQNCYFRLLP